MCHRDLVGGCNNFQIDRGLVTKYDLLAKHCWRKSVHEWELVDYLLVDTMQKVEMLERAEANCWMLDRWVRG